MEELFIKCPSWGTVLGVKNSKNEAVKRIVCPKCKHHLAVSFEEVKKQSAANVSLELVRMDNGGSKCIVSSLNSNETVSINGEPLLNDDKVVLAEGDRLEIGDVTLFYQKPYEQPVVPQPVITELKSTPSSKNSNSNKWIYPLVCGVAFIIAAFLLWPKSKVVSKEKPENKVAVVEKQELPEKTSEKPVNIGIKTKTEKSASVSKTEKTPDIQSLSDYDLEKKALSGDAKAQFELGKRLIRKPQSNNVIRGLNYLKLASRAGSSEASHLWQQTVNRLVARNDSASIYILKSIDE